MTPARIAATRAACLALQVALDAIAHSSAVDRRASIAERTAEREQQAGGSAAWSLRIRAQRQRQEGVEARAAADRAVSRYQALKEEAANA